MSSAPQDHIYRNGLLRYEHIGEAGCHSTHYNCCQGMELEVEIKPSDSRILAFQITPNVQLLKGQNGGRGGQVEGLD
jgi:hypothetical protein